MRHIFSEIFFYDCSGTFRGKKNIFIILICYIHSFTLFFAMHSREVIDIVKARRNEGQTILKIAKEMNLAPINSTQYEKKIIMTSQKRSLEQNQYLKNEKRSE